MSTTAMETITLDRLKKGQSAEIVTVRGNDAQTQRLLALGLVTGVEVSVVRVAPLGDPMEVSLRGFNLTLRKSEAALVEIEQ